MNIYVEKNKFETKVYDKRDDFPFKVISMPHFASNVPQNSSLGVFTSQIHRMFHANSKGSDFCENIKNMICKLIKQGFTKNSLKYKLCEFLKKNFMKLTFKYWEVMDLGRFFS